MKHKNTRQGLTQIKRVGQALPDNAPHKGHTATFIPPHPAFGHPLPQGARRTARGFTLIELLVVVLIIGILAAVAVPQYRKAVLKSRFTEAISIISALQKAQNVYRLANGTYTANIAQLDIDIPAQYTSLYWIYANPADPNHFYYSCAVNSGECAANAANSDYPLIHTVPGGYTIYCIKWSGKTNKAEDLCKSWGTYEPTASAQNRCPYYILNR